MQRKQPLHKKGKERSGHLGGGKGVGGEKKLAWWGGAEYSWLGIGGRGERGGKT